MGERGGEGVEDAFGCFARAAVRGGEEVEGVAWVEEGAQFYACFFGLGGEGVSGGCGCGGRGRGTCFHPSGVSFTRWSGTVWWISLFSEEVSLLLGIQMDRRVLLPSD